jgi:hypothetical protein
MTEPIPIAYEQIPELLAKVRAFELAYPEFCVPPPSPTLMELYAAHLMHGTSLDRARERIAARRPQRLAAVDLATGRRAWSENVYKWWQ